MHHAQTVFVLVSKRCDGSGKGHVERSHRLDDTHIAGMNRLAVLGAYPVPNHGDVGERQNLRQGKQSAED